QRLGNPAVSYSQVQAGVYLQDDIRITQSFTVSAGIREEWQSHVNGLHAAPRGGITWAPTKDGRTTIRAGGGIFYDWYTADTYAQTLQVNGTRQTDLVVQQPGYPDPFAGGFAVTVPPGLIRQAANLDQPEIIEGLVGVQRQFEDGVNVNAIYSHRVGRHLLQSVDANTPVPGAGRPDPLFGNIFQIESIGTSTYDGLILGVQYGNPKRHLMMGFNYILSRTINEADTPLSLPANSADPAAERGPAADDARHRFFSLVQVPLPKGLRLAVVLSGHSGLPYTITTGFDNNGDTVINDRPAGVGRNSARGAASVTTDARLSWTVGFGGAPAGPGGPVIVRVKPGGDVLSGLPAGPNQDRYSVTLYVQAYNLFNRFNPTAYSGVLTSPFFGEATSASPARRIEIGVRVGF
ncbi:MAG: TonB-dependent receptor, partial [Acidobacteriota bacterium]|nr:TonB-dependent receptor [Acidobacteriota bacterium]